METSSGVDQQHTYRHHRRRRRRRRRSTTPPRQDRRARRTEQHYRHEEYDDDMDEHEEREEDPWILNQHQPLYPCVVCKKTQLQSCSMSHPRFYMMWKDWMDQEQFEYQVQMGCTQWNSSIWGVVHVHETPHPELLLLKRVQACVGWAVHGLILEFLDGTRTGYVVDVNSIYDDCALQRKRPTKWHNIERGDYVTSVSGHHLSRGCFLCHTIRIHLASGRTITFESKHAPWRGDSFDYKLPEDSLLHHISFRKGKCVGVTAASSLLHLPVQSLQRVEQLSETHQTAFRFLQLVAQRVDNSRIQQGGKALGNDLWQMIVCQFLSCGDLEPFHASSIGTLLDHLDEEHEGT